MMWSSHSLRMSARKWDSLARCEAVCPRAQKPNKMSSALRRTFSLVLMVEPPGLAVLRVPEPPFRSNRGSPQRILLGQDGAGRETGVRRSNQGRSSFRGDPMQPRANLQPDESVVLEFDDLEPVRGFFEAAAQQGGFVVSLPRELKMFGRTAFAVSHAAGLRFEFQAEVIQVFPSGPGAFGTAFQLVGWGEAKQKELDRRLRTAARAASAEGGSDAEAAPDAGRPAADV